jgi:hypothetical protein
VGEAPYQRHKGLLGGVRAISVVARQTPTDGVEPLILLTEKGLKGNTIPPLSSQNQLFLRIVRPHLGISSTGVR